MGRFKINRTPANSKKAYVATGKNPVTGRRTTITGGIKKVIPGPKAQGKQKAKNFLKRHGAPTSAKQYINKVRWQKGPLFGKTINIPKRFFS